MATPTWFSVVREGQEFFGRGHVRFLRLPADVCAAVGDAVNALQTGGGDGFATASRFDDDEPVRAIDPRS